MRYPLVLFDLDGTLVDSLPDIAGALNHVLAAAGYATVPEPEVRGLVGEGVARLVEKALARQGRAGDRGAVPALAAAMVAHYGAHVCVRTRAFEGIEATLAALRAAPGRRLAVLTNKPGEAARGLLAALGLDRAFEAIVGDGDGFPRKPDPGAAHALLQRFETPATGTLLVGDGLPDLGLARAAGIAVAAAAWGYTDRAALAALQPDFLLDAPDDLLAIA